MPDYVPIQDLTILNTMSDSDYIPISDGSGAYAVRGSTFKEYVASDAAAAAADAAMSKTAAQNAATTAGLAQTAAEAAQAAAEAAEDTVEALADRVDFTWESGKIATPNVGTVVDIDTPTVSNDWHCVGTVVEGDVVTINASGSTSYRPYMILDADKKVIYKHGSNYVNGTTVMPASAAYIVVNTGSSTYKTAYKGGIPGTMAYRLAYTKQDQLTFDTEPTIGSTNPVTSGGIYTAIFGQGIVWTQHYIVETPNVGETATLEPVYASSDNRYYAIANVSYGQKVDMVTAGGSTSYRSYMFVDSNNVVLQRAPTHYDGVHSVKVPYNAAKLVLNLVASVTIDPDDYPVSIKDIPVSELIANEYAGCRLSLLGDSLSAYGGWIPSGNHKYYPNVNSDVDSVDQMWWKIVCDELDMIPLVINAWSGSGVAAGIRTPSETNTYTPASDVSRAQGLDSGGNDPDVVLCAIGTNDYSYMSQASQFGTWDGHTALGTSTDIALTDYDNTTFRSAYATMLARIQKKYPNAFIVCFTLFYQHRYSTNTGVTYLNDINKTVEDYNIAIREVAGQMNVPVIDVTNIGFNRNNFYPTYAEDSSVKPTHLTIAGHRQLALSVIQQLKSLHRFGYGYSEEEPDESE